MLADCLVLDSGVQREDHWNEQAKTLILGVILHVCTAPEYQASRHLVAIRELLQEDEAGFKELLFQMHKNGSAGGEIGRVARQIANTPANERGSIVSSANRHLRFIASESLQGVLKSSTFDVSRLKSEAMTVFVVMPAKFLTSHNRWLRMMVTVAMLGATREGDKPKVPVVWMLDELAHLGHLKAVSDAYGLLRGFGYRIWGVFQDLPPVAGNLRGACQVNDIGKRRSGFQYQRPRYRPILRRSIR